MSRRSFVSAAASLLLLVPAVAAWAGSHSSALLHPSKAGGAFGFGGPSAAYNGYNVSTALSTALSVGNPSEVASINVGQAGLGGKKAPIVQLNSAPTVQTAIGAAVSIGGNASAAAINTNDVSQLGQH